MGRRWVKERKEDYYYRKAKEEMYRSRAAFKLFQLNNKFRLIKRGGKVVDLGAAPGGWMQVARKIVGREGLVLGVDLEKIAPLGYENVASIVGDVFAEGTIASIKELIPAADVVLSDASPDISGVWTIDHLKSVDLCRRALQIAESLLKPGGNILFKIFQGEEAKELYLDVKERFDYAKMTKPKASREQSAEMYVVGKGFKPRSGP